MNNDTIDLDDEINQDKYKTLLEGMDAYYRLTGKIPNHIFFDIDYNQGIRKYLYNGMIIQCLPTSELPKYGITKMIEGGVNETIN